ncbi:6-hydroxymethylpterin diphosphokinase MptE-like protein [Lederbergia citri]|uniref:DUF115 domain-containing protein n=1 Tax=Lederbergia citri TaxID=2833580 RepID=A0A942YKQ3_9BACI|nr:6-hydroxymethylpterin diphosphokinase MptE-like protein [Lederbergia citri]MBS4197586.1 DUF115 domain-containing protein [Lederbergia citri]
MNIKATLKKNKYIYSLVIQLGESHWRIKRYLKLYIIPNIIFNIRRFLRVYRFYKDSPYEKLKNVKDKHYGERCFIIATGPSLTIEDLEKLKGETTISMNSICLAFDETDWRPTYYGVQDEIAFIRMKKYIDELDVECKFVGDTIPKKLDIDFSGDYYYYPINMLNHKISPKKDHIKFSNDPFAAIYNGYTITYSLIQIAVYMGFKEIYLLGTDCNYSTDLNHHFRNYDDYVDPYFLYAGEMMIKAYKVAKKYADKNNIKIYNATRGGMLEVFERVDLDSVLAMNNDNTRQLHVNHS